MIITICLKFFKDNYYLYSYGITDDKIFIQTSLYILHSNWEENYNLSLPSTLNKCEIFRFND